MILANKNLKNIRKMKKIMTIVALFGALSTDVIAQTSVDDFAVQSTTDTMVTLVGEMTLPFPGFYYVHRDVDSMFPNPTVVVQGTLIGAGITNTTFTDDSLVPSVNYFYKLVAVCDWAGLNERDSIILLVNTAVPAEVNNLLGNFTQTSPITLTTDYMAHSFATTVKCVRVSDGAIMAVQPNLIGSGIQTITFTFPQTVNTVEDYITVAWNVFHSSVADYDTSNTWTVSTMTPIVMQPPIVDSISASLISFNGLSAFFSWDSDSLPGTVYLYYLCNGAFPGNIVTIFSVPPGAGDTILSVPFFCQGSANVHLMVILENAFGGFDRDTLIRAFSIPPPPLPASGALRPYAVWIDSIAMSSLIQVDSISVVSPSSFIQIEAIDVDTAHNGAFALVIPIQGPVTNVSVSRVFNGAPGHCYYLRSVLVDGNTITQTWYIQSTPICFPGIPTDIVEQTKGWQSSPDKLTPRDFPTEVTVIDIQGREVIVNQAFESLSDVTNAIPSSHGMFIAYTVDKNTHVKKVAKLFK
jgi:hypothetical protein